MGHKQQATRLKPHRIAMQIGDNIEDVQGITQVSANVEAWLPSLGKDNFLLPNAVYGSW
ncbi:MAG: hypothetical protein ACFHVJ_14280 [Aestuariibacter sp.]